MNDEQPHHDNSGPARCLLFSKLANIPGEQNGDDQMREAHTESADGEDGLAAYAVDVEHCRDGRKEHDDADHAGSEK
jgi:hypothetical protein